MLAKVAPSSNDFQALARYLVHGKTGTSPDPRRVAWVLTQNLPTDDPDLAAKYMTATAQLSARTRKAAYHFMIAWHRNERPSPEAMQQVARLTLQMAGLEEHQALVMGHGDKPHPHLHVLLNRVHPDTGRAWKPSQDFACFDRIMQALADAHGFTFVPAHAFNPEATDNLPTLPDSSATYAGKRGAPTLRPQWSKAESRALGDTLSEDLTMEATPDDVLDSLTQHGLTIEAKGKGHVVGNANGYVKLSRLALHTSARGQELLRQAASTVPPPPSKRRRVFDIDGVDIARALMAWGLADKADLAAAIENEQQARRASRTRTSGTTMLAPVSPSAAVQSDPHSQRSRAREQGGR